MPKKRLSIKILPVLAFLLFPGDLLRSQVTDYRDIFGNDWEKAEEFVTSNEKWMKQIAGKFKISYQHAVAVVFPELIRYSALRDRMEVTLLKTLYINLGEEYANFSVGHFQMKPSFAEAINENVNILKGRLPEFFPGREEYSPEWRYRSAIVGYLENTQSQFLYLVAFMKICDKKFDLSVLNDENRVKFLSAAYNFSFQRSFDEITLMADRKFFSTKLVTTEYYSYSDISLYWYRLHNGDR